MNIVYASNDNYARHLAVSLYSLLEHSQDEKDLQVYILSLGLTEEAKDRIEAIAEGFGREAAFIELGSLKERFSYQVDTGGFDISIMARLFVGEVLPETVDRIIYLDCDTVILGSLRALWKTELHSALVGAVMEPTIYPEVMEQIGLKREEPYFNSGVLLIDLKRWRMEKTGEKLLEFYGQKGGRLFAGDQDTINGGLRGRIKPLSPAYNFFTNYRYYRYSHLVRLSPIYGRISREAFQAAKRHPVILHYMGDERPWVAGNLNHYRLAYTRYLKKTPWRGAPKEKGKRLYMLLYHLMDYATFVCPPVRDMVSRSFGMRVINSRKGPGKKQE